MLSIHFGVCISSVDEIGGIELVIIYRNSFLII